MIWEKLPKDTTSSSSFLIARSFLITAVYVKKISQEQKLHNDADYRKMRALCLSYLMNLFNSTKYKHRLIYKQIAFLFFNRCSFWSLHNLFEKKICNTYVFHFLCDLSNVERNLTAVKKRYEITCSRFNLVNTLNWFWKYKID